MNYEHVMRWDTYWISHLNADHFESLQKSVCHSISNNIIFNFHKAYNGLPFAEEIVVESTFTVRQKLANSSQRITREAPLPSLIISRIKRQYQQYQPNANNHGSSQSTAQSHSHAHDFGSFGFQSADALAGAQGKFWTHLFVNYKNIIIYSFIWNRSLPKRTLRSLIQ